MRLLALFSIAAACCGQVEALPLTAVHAGVMVCDTECNRQSKDGGQNIEIQASFESPGFLVFAGSPQPYLAASANTAGETSFVGFGLEWRWEVADDWAVSPSFGYVLHDGAIEGGQDHVLLGSRDLFRSALGISRDLPGPWEAQVMIEHLSHGQILGSGRNQGLDQIGLRLGYRFDEYRERGHDKQH